MPLEAAMTNLKLLRPKYKETGKDPLSKTESLGQMFMTQKGTFIVEELILLQSVDSYYERDIK